MAKKDKKNNIEVENNNFEEVIKTEEVITVDEIVNENVEEVKPVEPEVVKVESKVEVKKEVAKPMKRRAIYDF